MDLTVRLHTPTLRSATDRKIAVAQQADLPCHLCILMLHGIAIIKVAAACMVSIQCLDALNICATLQHHIIQLPSTASFSLLTHDQHVLQCYLHQMMMASCCAMLRILVNSSRTGWSPCFSLKAVLWLPSLRQDRVLLCSASKCVLILPDKGKVTCHAWSVTVENKSPGCEAFSHAVTHL